MINLNQCSISCNPDEYGDPTFMMCFKCNPACASCTSSTICSSCQSINGIAYYRDVDKCTVNCPSNQFGKVTTFQCTNCANQCSTCFGELNTNCRTCKNYNNADYYLVYGTNYCSLICPSDQYKNITDLTCRLCSVLCKTCQTTSTNCLSCG